MPDISLFVVTDGRMDCLKKTLRSLVENVNYNRIEQKFIVNDCVDPVFVKELTTIACYNGFELINHETKKGFSGAYNTAFANVSKESDYCFILEDDFTFNEPIDIMQMVNILKANPHLCQVALKRQAWNQSEKKAGGIIEQDPDSFQDKVYGSKCDPIYFCQHRKFFTTNPSLVPAWVIKRGWPLVEHSEGIFSLSLFEDPTTYSAYLGQKFDAPKVHHIGEVRNGTGY